MLKCARYVKYDRYFVILLILQLFVIFASCWRMLKLSKVPDTDDYIFSGCDAVDCVQVSPYTELHCI